MGSPRPPAAGASWPVQNLGAASSFADLTDTAHNSCRYSAWKLEYCASCRVARTKCRRPLFWIAPVGTPVG
jgi:hypothetical protein